mmetsp:Transcript_100847/g.174184  ORF Transcript_100847/g.174184 Transcript_100847/m.174184 type:complete len:326 (+) Transcript_100847:177-1154(+)
MASRFSSFASSSASTRWYSSVTVAGTRGSASSHSSEPEVCAPSASGLHWSTVGPGLKPVPFLRGLPFGFPAFSAFPVFSALPDFAFSALSPFAAFCPFTSFSAFSALAFLGFLGLASFRSFDFFFPFCCCASSARCAISSSRCCFDTLLRSSVVISAPWVSGGGVSTSGSDDRGASCRGWTMASELLSAPWASASVARTPLSQSIGVPSVEEGPVSRGSTASDRICWMDTGKGWAWLGASPSPAAAVGSGPRAEAAGPSPGPAGVRGPALIADRAHSLFWGSSRPGTSASRGCLGSAPASTPAVEADAYSENAFEEAGHGSVKSG